MWLLFAVAMCTLAVTSSLWAQAKKELRVAAAADLQPILPGIADRYEKATGVKLVVSFGSSGNLATQIINGAPMDLFLGADFVFPEKVVAAGLADGTAPIAVCAGDTGAVGAEGFAAAADQPGFADGQARDRGRDCE